MTLQLTNLGANIRPGFDRNRSPVSQDSAHARSRPATTYRADIDGLRAVAALAVIGSHIGIRALTGGTAGVDIFFVISGYLITGIILRDLVRKQFSCFDFYVRRVRRIFPALLAVIIAVWAFGWLFLLPDEYRSLGKDILGSSTFIQNFVVYRWIFQWSVPQDNFPRILLSHIWSLGVEEQFYLLWPLLLLAAWRSRTVVISVLAVVVAGSFSLNAVYSVWDFPAAADLPWNRLWELGMGGGLAYAQLRVHTNSVAAALSGLDNRSRLKWCAPNHFLAFVGALLMGLSIAGLNIPMAFPGWWALAPSGGALLVIASGPDSWLNQYLLSARPMVLIGLISYPLYLWHVPLIWFAHILEAKWVLPATATSMALVASFLLAALTYKYIELPIRHCVKPLHVAVGLCVLLFGCGILGYLTWAGRVPARSELRSAGFALTVDGKPAAGGLIGWQPPSADPVSIGSGAMHVLFVGDGSMRQFLPRVSKVLSEHPFNSHGAVFATYDWCAPAVMDLMRTEFSERFRQNCKSHISRALAYAQQHSVDTVVIGKRAGVAQCAGDDFRGRLRESGEVYPV